MKKLIVCLALISILGCNQNKFYELGMQNMNSKNYEEAIKNFTKAAEKNPSDSINKLIGLAHSNIASKMAEEKNYLGAIDYINRAISLGVNTYEIYETRAVIKSKANLDKEASKDFLVAIEKQLERLSHAPNDANIKKSVGSLCYMLGLTQDKQNDITGAIESFVYAMEFNFNEYSGVLKEIGLIHYQNGNYTKAIIYLTAEIKRDESDYLYAIRSQAKSLSGDATGAMEDILKVKIPFVAGLYNKYEIMNGIIITSQNRKYYKEALEYINFAIRLEPNSHPLYVARGVTNLYLNKRYEACIDFNYAYAKGVEDAKGLIEVNCKND